MELGCWGGRKALRGFLLSTTAALSFSGGLMMQAGPASAQQGQAAGALPSVVVSAPQQRARRVLTATTSRAARSNRRTATAAPVEKKPPSVNNQDARTGQKGYVTRSVTSATKTNTALLNVPQSVTVLTKDFIRDQAFTSIGEATRYVPGVIYHQGESHRDDLVIRGQRSNADFYTNGIRDDVQYFRDFYNIQRLEVLKGPNAMIFGRGGGGGVVNRVLKDADGTTIREVTVGGNSYPGARVTTDVGQAINENWAFRLNAMYENTQSYRDFVNLERWAINPTATFAPNDTTTVKLSYEHLHDRRTVDRGIPSQIRPGNAFPRYPYDTSPSAFFGNPNLNYALADVDIGTAVVEHDFENGWTIKNSSQIANYDKFYQNIYPGGGANSGAVNAAGTSSNLQAYNNETDRTNYFNQTDLTYRFGTGPIRHTVVFGAEVGRQNGLNYRQSGLFNGISSTITIDPRNPTSYVPVTFANNGGTDANNTYKLNLGAVYVQDQVEITRYLELIGGLRFDHFDLTSRDRRTFVELNRVDDLVSPRAGVVFKPLENLSIYGSYSISYLPSAGDQFSALTPGLVIAAPEKFVNKEVGLKYDIFPSLQFATAIYELDRTNQRFADPNNAGFFILSGATKTRGVEASLTGYVTDAWQITGGYAYTDARITSNNSATIVAGNRVGLVPYNTFSLWNKYQFTEQWAAGLGVIHYSNFFASSDDTVLIPEFTRVDAAVYFRLNETWRAQLNIENLLDRKYYSTADGNNNITPGSPRVFRLSATANF
ncbi:catecholate siderophore receptor [Bradyrhizobium japonicum USDA 38]|uniref:TonB-dependent receptor n=1 Tax=Bradyrhizobium japonicum TaxID=375 RepID=UPI0004285CBE|nr:TonB-dependent siderophore receptor [Bradyrhizobium japonicum]MCS3898219.1 catecholate siderophore receptor [Bradyrhizobium japonicum USDA 38]MCS3941272.1 catecholate siderophore receptor [Bradyrhizobium japonicum]MCW2216673.1 catecholate siderophore receptor [Bradyrhizobium japonicum]MCW2341289.1 catecholate siderophore receptor [Bradyrhizobium japonicum]